MMNDDTGDGTRSGLTDGLEVVAEYGCVTGEGPLWHPEEERLYWVDIPKGRLYRYEPATDSHERCHDGRPIGGFTLEADGALLLFRDQGTVTRWMDGRTRVVADLPDEGHTRFNDVVADPEGRVFAGTMPTEDQLGRLYRFDPGGSYTILNHDLDLPNGMSFTPDRTTLYLSVSDQCRVYRYDYDESTGVLANRTTFLDLDGSGVPDGLTVDTDGFVWVARWNGGRIERYAPDGELTRTMEIFVERPSSMAFSGTRYDDLYITSARGEDNDTDRKVAGALFRTQPGHIGRPEFRSRVAMRE